LKPKDVYESNTEFMKILSPLFKRRSTGWKLTSGCMSVMKVNCNHQCWTLLGCCLTDMTLLWCIFFNSRGQV
jgi:hypothetical protein